MEKVKSADDWAFIPATEWVRQLAEETAAFDVAKVVEGESRRGERWQMEWDQIVTLSVKPDQRSVVLFVQTRQHLSPNTALGVFQKLRWVPPDGILLLCVPYI